MTYYSASALKKYILCPRNWYHAYLEEERDEAGEAARLGIAVHAALEAAAHDGREPAEHYHTAFRDHGPSDFALYQEGSEMLDWFASVVNPNRVLRNGEGRPVVEWRFQVPLTETIGLHGVIDRLEASAHSLEVIDFKTGWWYPTEEELLDDPQIIFYVYAARTIATQLGIPLQAVTISLALARSKRLVTVIPDDETLTERVDFFRLLLERLAQAETNALERLGPDRPLGWDEALAPQFPERLNRYCTHCERQRDCRIYQQALAGPLDEPTPETLAELLEAYDRNRTIEKLAADRKEALRATLVQQIGPDQTLKEGPFSARVTVPKKRSVVTADALAAAGDNGSLRESVLATTNVGITDYLKLLKGETLTRDERERLSAAIRESDGSPTLTVKRIGG
jgi:hypothetical protein